MSPLMVQVEISTHFRSPGAIWWQLHRIYHVCHCFFKTAMDALQRCVSSTWLWSSLDRGENRPSTLPASTIGLGIGKHRPGWLPPWPVDCLSGLLRDCKRTTATCRPANTSPPSFRGASGVLGVARHEIGVSQRGPDVWFGLMGDEGYK